MYTIKDNDNLKKLGDNIRIIRESKELTKEMCAVECDISRSYLYRLEQGKANPSILELFKISKGMNCSIIELLQDI